MYFLTALLIFLLYVQIIVLYRRKKWGWTYNNSYSINLDHIIACLEVLSNSSATGCFYLSSSKFPSNIYFLKNQNERVWWFELLIKTDDDRCKELFINSFSLENKTSRNSTSYSDKSLNKYNRYNLGYDKTIISALLSGIFINHFGIKEENKITVKFINVQVEKGLILA